MADFLFTWKPETWPYENFQALIRRYEAEGTALEYWRCKSHKLIKPGDRAYVFKQGAPPNGVFGVGIVDGYARLREGSRPGESDHEVPIRFELILDPTKNEYISLKESLPDAQWNSQSSGMPFDSDAARAVDKALTQASPLKRNFKLAVSASKKYERMLEAYYRNQTLVSELKNRYDGCCQICGTVPFSGELGSISEGHHVNWLCRGGEDSLDNLILVCPNHHAVIHASAPAFDWLTLSFEFGNKKVRLRLNKHLKPASL